MQDNHSGEVKVSPLRQVSALFQGEGSEIGVVLVYGIAVSVLSLAIPIGVQTVVNTVAFATLSQPLVFLVLAVFVGLGTASFFRTVQVVLVERLQMRLFAKVALELAHRIPRRSFAGIWRDRFPELVNRFFDILTIQKSSALLLLEGFGLILQVIIGLTLLTFYHPFLLAFGIALIGCIAFIIFVLGRGAIETSIDESVEKYRVAAWLEELAGKHLAFRSRASRNLAFSRANEVVADYIGARRRHFRIVLRQVIGSLLLQSAASAALLGIGAWLVIRQQLTLGQLVAAEIVVTTALSSLAKLQKHLETFYDLVAAADKIGLLMDLPLEREGGIASEGGAPFRIELRNASFRYPDGSWQLENFSLTVEGGERVALLGANGSGKSTLVDLLYGIRPLDQGFLTFDGRDSRTLDIEQLRSQIVLVRGLEFFSASLFENVRLGNPSLGADEVCEALRKLDLLDEVLAFPEGLETRLGEGGSPLSVTQARRLMLARAIVNKPRLVLVDESLDELDAPSLEASLRALNDPAAPWTLLVTTHNPEVAHGIGRVHDLNRLIGGLDP